MSTRRFARASLALLIAGTESGSAEAQSLTNPDFMLPAFRRLLMKQVSAEFEDTPFDEAVKHLQSVAEGRLRVDRKSPDNLPFDTSQAVTLERHAFSTRSTVENIAKSQTRAGNSRRRAPGHDRGRS